jgi:hypothetical protein
MLRLALRKAKNPEKASEEKEELDALEQAMSDFESASNSADKAAAFRAALELAKSE